MTLKRGKLSSKNQSGNPSCGKEKGKLIGAVYYILHY